MKYIVNDINYNKDSKDYASALFTCRHFMIVYSFKWKELWICFNSKNDNYIILNRNINEI